MTKYLSDKNIHDKVPLQKVVTAKCFYGEKFLRSNVHTAKCCTAKCLRWNIIWRESLVPWKLSCVMLLHRLCIFRRFLRYEIDVQRDSFWQVWRLYQEDSNRNSEASFYFPLWSRRNIKTGEIFFIRFNLFVSRTKYKKNLRSADRYWS